MSKNRMAGDKLSNISYRENYSREGLDPELANKAASGKHWGAQDQSRYEKLVQKKEEGNATVTRDDIKGMRAKHGELGGGNLRTTLKHFEKMEGRGYNFGEGAQEAMENMRAKVGRYDKRRAAKERAKGNNENGNIGTQPVQPPQQGEMPPGTEFDDSTSQTYGVGRDLNQNVGKKGDTNTTIGDNNNIGHGATIGGDYSVTIGGNSAGNGQGGHGGPSFGMNNMERAVAYGALNENSYHRSKAQLNGAGRAAQASAAANDITGATNRVANLYNATGIDQNYWRSKADAQSNFYLGDIFKEGFGGYDWTMPDSPNKIEDNTQDIYEDAKEEIKDV